MTRFEVDKVKPAGARLPTSPRGSRHPGALAIGGDPTQPVIDHGGTHPLLAAVGLAFAQHRPLVLSPDAVWLTIAQGVAQHVRLNAAALRDRLVRHQGEQRLTLETGAMPTDAAGWANVVAGLRGLVAEQIGEGRARLFECDFSTSTDVDLLASQIVLLDAYAPYFSYWMVAICGIPAITLTGTPEDWRRIRARVDVIAELDLGFWCASLVPILDQFVRASEGDEDVGFWRRIYNPQDAYGGEIITGWITRLYPYVKFGNALDTKNPMLALPIDEPKRRTTLFKRRYEGPGLRSDAVPATVSRVTVHVVDLAAGTQRDVEFLAGVTAVTQDADGALRPIAGWHLSPASPQIVDLAARILRDHHGVPAHTGDARDPHEGPAEVAALFRQLDSADLFEGERAWRLRSPPEHHPVEIERGGQFLIQRIADLPGGRSLCVASKVDEGTVHWLVCRIEPQAPPSPVELEHRLTLRRCRALDLPAEIRVLRGSLADILDAALRANGDIDHLEIGRFDELLRPRAAGA